MNDQIEIQKFAVGRVVRIKPEWQDAGDAEALFIVRTPAEPGKLRVDISAIDHIEMPFWPMGLAQTYMLEATDILLSMEG